MLKYFDAKDKYVVDEPSLWTVNGSVDILYAGGTEHKSGNFTILVGNIESYNPTELDPEPEPEITPTPTPSGGGDTPSGGGDEPGGGGETPVDPTPSGNYITLEIKNNLGIEARFNGRVVLNIGHNANTWDGSTQVHANIYPETSDWHKNHIVIKSGETKQYNVQIEPFLPGSPDHTTATNGTWHILGVQNSVNLSNPVYLYSAMEYGNGAPNDSEHTRGVAHSSSSMYIASIPSSTLILNKQTYHIEINQTALDALGHTMTLESDMTGYYVVLKPEETAPDPTPIPSSGMINTGTVNVTIYNRSETNFAYGNSINVLNTDNNQYISVDTGIYAYLKIYLSGHKSVILAIKDNSSDSDTAILPDNDPNCRWIQAGYTLGGNGLKSISNVHWRANSNVSADWVSAEDGRAFEQGAKNTIYIGNGIYSMADCGYNISISGENGVFKNGGTYIVTIN